MRCGFIFIMWMISGIPPVFAHRQPEHVIIHDNRRDSIKPIILAVNENRPQRNPSSVYAADINTLFPVTEYMTSRVAVKGQLGFSKNGRPLTAFYFPGRSDKKALVIGGVHGSELSGIEIANKLAERLEKSQALYYNVVVIPCLFPDNELVAIKLPDGTKKAFNAGRYSNKESVDPNRQMPAPGKPFNPAHPVDYLGRPIEKENQLLLQLINEYQPDRVINLHSIRDIKHAGIFADPRTDHQGFALGFETDSSLAIEMAKYIYENGGNVAGNHLDSIPTALYYLDPPIATEGLYQHRSSERSAMLPEKGRGVSLGTWASTAICDSLHPSFNRPSMRLITVEFPGYKRPGDYQDSAEQAYQANLVDLYTTAIQHIFLALHYEEHKTDPCLCKRKNENQEKYLTGN